MPFRSTSGPKRIEMCQQSLVALSRASRWTLASALAETSWPGGGLGAEEGAQGFGDGFAGGLEFVVRFHSARLDHAEQGADVVAAGQQGRDHVAADLDLAVAQAVEDVLEDVGEFLDGVDFDDAGAALDGVRGTEYGIDGLGIAVALFELHQPGFHGFELFAGFDAEDAEDFVHDGFLSGAFAGGDHQRVAEEGGEVEEFDDFAHRRAVADDVQLVFLFGAFALGQGQQLQAGGVDFADVREVELQYAVAAHAVDQALPDLGRVIDGQVTVHRQAHGALGGGLVGEFHVDLPKLYGGECGSNGQKP
jgi:hypothetical protein